MIGSRGYNAYEDKRTALYLLNNILGGPGMNSRLNVALRERRGLVYNVESNLLLIPIPELSVFISVATRRMRSFVPALCIKN